MNSNTTIPEDNMFSNTTSSNDHIERDTTQLYVKMQNNTIFPDITMFSNTTFPDDNMFNNTTFTDLNMFSSTNLSGVTSQPLLRNNSTLSQYFTETMVNNSGYINSTDMYDIYNYEEYDYGDEIMYPGYDFERALYLYIWEIMVIVTSLVNIVVISVFLRRKMRNATNIILAAIALSDSLTGLVTLPTYIMVFARHDPLEEYYYSNDYLNNETDYNYNNYLAAQYELESSSGNLSVYPVYQDVGVSQEPVDGYTLTEDLCNAFMVSKYFLSKMFHTVSIFLTLFLAIQRYVSVAFPYKSQFLFNIKRTLICCVAIFIVSPALHSYHLGGKKAMGGLCQWELQEQGCGSVCIYLWIAFFLRHFTPCVILVVFSALFISQLHVGEEGLRRINSNRSQISRRVEENRRITFIVTAIVIIFLVPEIPYGIFLLYNAIDKVANEGRGIDLKTNRAIQMTYEITLVLSFHANFYIYTLFNRRFRKVLYRTIVKPVRRLVGDPRRLSITRTSSTSHQGSTRKTTMTNSKTIDSKVQLDSNWVHSNDIEKVDATEMKPMKSFSPDDKPSPDELEPLNENL